MLCCYHLIIMDTGLPVLKLNVTVTLTVRPNGLTATNSVSLDLPVYL